MELNASLTKYAGITVYVASSTEKKSTSLPTDPALLAVVNKAQATITLFTFQSRRLKKVEEMRNVPMNSLNDLEGNTTLKTYLLRWQHAIS